MAVNFMPDWRSVYFNTLDDYNGYDQIYQQGQQVTQLSPSFNIKNNQQGKQKIQLALKVLNNAILQERNTEQQYVTNLINSAQAFEDPQLKEAFSAKIKSIFNNEGAFDYLEFINLINNILLGNKEYEAILKLEQQREKELTAAFDKIEKNLLKQEQQTNPQVNERQLKNNLKESLRTTYLQRHSFSNSQFSQYFSKITPTIDYILTQHIIAEAEKILKSSDLLNLIKEQIRKQGGTKQEIITYILNNLISQVNKQIPKLAQAAIKKEAVSINHLIADLDLNFETIVINGEASNFADPFKNGRPGVDFNGSNLDKERSYNNYLP